MFAVKARTEVVIRIFLIAVILFSALSPSTASATSSGDEQETNNSTNTNNDLASGLALGITNPSAYEKVPVLSEQISTRAQQQVEEKPVAFNVWAEPAIYTPGKPISFYWTVENIKLDDSGKTEVVIHAPEGLTPADPNSTYTKDGLITIALGEKNTASWNVNNKAELPIYFTLDLLVNDDLIASESVMIDEASFSIEKNTSGKVTGLDGKVEVEIPANATKESLNIDIREPAPNTLPGVALTWQPLEIIAVGTASQKNVEEFDAPIKLTVNYDEEQIFHWDEKALTIYYYDEKLPTGSRWIRLWTRRIIRSRLIAII